MRCIIFVGLLLVSFIAVAARPATQAELEWLKEGLQGQLKDPYSAKLRNVQIGPQSDTGMHTACGMVNAKNSYGAYSGEEPFYGVVVPDKKVGIVMAIGEVAATQCATEGLL